jgi:hypothetical protein
VPEHQKWMNGGKFDGGLLSPEQKQLRQFYVDLLNLSMSNPAIADGEYMDLTEHNINKGNFNTTVSAYLRYKGEDRLLILNSFNSKDETIKVQIPADAMEKMGLSKSGEYIARDLLWREVEVGLTGDFVFELKLKPYSSFIFKIK